MAALHEASPIAASDRGEERLRSHRSPVDEDVDLIRSSTCHFRWCDPSRPTLLPRGFLIERWRAEWDHPTGLLPQ